MINQLVILDDEDVKLGSFFNLCATYAYEVSDSSKHEINCRRVCAHEVNAENISNHLAPINQERFIFLSFLHGSSEAMFINGSGEIVSVHENYYLFTKGFIYTFSCYNGSVLADQILNNGAELYWGYIDKAWVHTDYEEDFKECALAGYQYFLQGYTAKDAYLLMQEFINNKIDELYQTDFVAASTLMRNRDALVLKGNDNLRVTDFQV